MALAGPAVAMIALAACAGPRLSGSGRGTSAQPARDAGESRGGREQAPALGSEGGPKVVARLFRPVYLWCGEPTGRACEQAAAALGVAPVLADQIPAELLTGFQDVANDCEDEQVRRLRRSLERPLSLDARSWADQVGTEIAPGQIGQRYEGGGCITSGQREGPTVKIHVQPSAEPPLALVRVWEPGAR